MYSVAWFNDDAMTRDEVVIC